MKVSIYSVSNTIVSNSGLTCGISIVSSFFSSSGSGSGCDSGSGSGCNSGSGSGCDSGSGSNSTANQ